MTAEIAVLNKSAIVLAADSAVTVESGGSAKVFNTANKIFEISDVNPIALMVFNKLDYMDLPIEVLAKEYRRKRGQTSFPTVRACRLDFMSFLEKEVLFSDQDKKSNFAAICYDVISEVSIDFQRALDKHIRQMKRVLVSKFNGILKDMLQDKIKNLEKLPKASGFGEVRLSDEYKKVIDPHLQFFFPVMQLNQVCKKELYKLISLSISQSKLSGLLTGLVFAGFGEDEICPTLDHIEMDGILDNKLKTVEINCVDIGRTGPSVDIIGFAQDDMVQSFVNGINPSLRDYSQTLVREAIESSAKLTLSPIFKDQAKLEDAMSKLAPDFNNLSDSLKNQRDRFIKKNYTQEVQDMVRLMPREEMANLAEALIDITSLKRRVTRDRETVGGEVDVAVISKAEGLVWVKRKHYFPAELNSRYQNRMGKR